MKPSSAFRSVFLAALLSVALSPHAVSQTSPATVGPFAESVSWEGPVMGPRGVPEMTFRHDYVVSVDVSASYWAEHEGGLEVSIKFPATLDLNLYVYAGDYEQGEVAVGTSIRSGTTEETVTVDKPSGRYTVRTQYFAGVPDRYSGSATFVSRTLATDASFDTDRELSFGPATIVSAHFLGPEPMLTMERELPDSEMQEGFEDRTDRQRLFVDWPLSPLDKIGQLSRSTDGGDSFRLLFDLDCAEFSRPTCTADGGSDTHAEVNLSDGTLYFSTQELVSAQAFSSSTDNGDSFPQQRQQPAVNTATGSDRQWIAPAGKGVRTVHTTAEAFFAYHVPGVGQFIHAVDGAGRVEAQANPQIVNVIQSGPLRVDTSPNSPGKGWIYQPYYSFAEGGAGGGTEIRVATSPAEQYALPSAWESTTVSPDSQRIFSWLDIDQGGNAYLVWVKEGGKTAEGVGEVFYSASPIRHPDNNPSLASPGRPGTYWTPPVRISLPAVQNAIFPEVVAGVAGRIAITYLGTEHYGGIPREAPADTVWNAYASIVSNALGTSAPPVVTSGTVSHRPVHRGSICELGPFCGKKTDDFSLADMIDIGFDQQGRVGVVFGDNNSGFASPNGMDKPKERPFAHFAKQRSGPTLLSDQPLGATPAPTSGADASRDATWPNRSKGERWFPSLDVLDTRVHLDDVDLVAEVDLASASSRTRKDDLTSYNDIDSSNPAADRLQYVVRYSTEHDVYHLSMESLGDGRLRFFGGVLGANDRLVDGQTTSDACIPPITSCADKTTRGAGYHSDAEMPVTGSIDGDTLILRTAASGAGVDDGSRIYSVTGFAMAGPSEERETTIFDPMRTVDATPAFDLTLVRPDPEVTPTPDPTGTESGGGEPTPAPTASDIGGGEPTPAPTETESGGGDPTPAPTGSAAEPTPSPEPGSHVLALSPDATTIRVGSSSVVTAKATDPEGDPVEGVEIVWESRGIGAIVESDPVTDAGGTATAIVASEEPGDQWITARTGPCTGADGCSGEVIVHYGPKHCDVFGTRGNDLLEGTTAGDVICGFGGADAIWGNGGDDLILGGAGSDRLFGGLGDDRLKGGAGEDELRGGRGADRLAGGSDSDDLYGASGRDILRGGAGADLLDAGAGRDVCRGGRGRDRLLHCE